MVALYVDDLLIAGSTKNMVTQLESIFEAKYKIKKLNTIKQSLGTPLNNHFALEFSMTNFAILYILLSINIMNILSNYLESMV
jgi:hypothetical protein